MNEHFVNLYYHASRSQLAAENFFDLIDPNDHAIISITLSIIKSIESIINSLGALEDLDVTKNENK